MTVELLTVALLLLNKPRVMACD